MTLKEAHQIIIEGKQIALIAEYRGSKAETIKYVDKKSQRAAEMRTLRHNIEVGDTALAFNERVDDNFNTETYKSPYSKGQKVFVTLTALQNDKGVVRASGKLEAIN